MLACLESVIVEPSGVAHLHEAGRRVPQELEFLVAETKGEVGEERGLSARHIIRGIHKAPRQRVVRQRSPARSRLFLPRMRQIKSVSPFRGTLSRISFVSPRPQGLRRPPEPER